MAENSLYPAFFRLFSKSEFGYHVSTHPMNEYTPVAGAFGTFKNWIDGNVAANTEISGFVDLLLPFFTGDTEYLYAIVYDMEDENATPRPRVTVPFTGKTGTSVTAAVPASQSTYTFRTTNFGLAKLVLLDAPVTTDFQPITSLASAPDMQDVLDYISDDEHCFRGRDQGRITTFVRATFKLNDELRKQYRLS